VLHPFDLATNKVLALVGRLEPRDWIDVIECNDRLQPLGYLAWAASGKDPGFSPKGILDAAAQSGRYSAAEIGALDFDGTPPDAADLSRRWHAWLGRAAQAVDVESRSSISWFSEALDRFRELNQLEGMGWSLFYLPRTWERRHHSHNLGASSRRRRSQATCCPELYES
jgi:hypothetical protein